MSLTILAASAELLCILNVRKFGDDARYTIFRLVQQNIAGADVAMHPACIVEVL